jgi:transposase-like protein
MGKRGPKSQFDSISCPNKNCIDYGISGKGNVVGNGTYITKSGRIRKYICKSCGLVFSDRINTAFYDIRTEESKMIDACKLVIRGMSIRGVAEHLEVKPDTVSKWLNRAAIHCQGVNEVLMRDLDISKVELDELWTFVQKKQLRKWKHLRTMAPGSG